MAGLFKKRLYSVQPATKAVQLTNFQNSLEYKVEELTLHTVLQYGQYDLDSCRNKERYLLRGKYDMLPSQHTLYQSTHDIQLQMCGSDLSQM